MSDNIDWDKLNAKFAGYYDRAGNEITFETWAKDVGDGTVRRVARDEVDGVTVSTVFLGMNLAIGMGPPLLFETMLFDYAGTYASGIDGDMERYATEAEAIEGHTWIVAVLQSNSLKEQP